MRTVLSIFVLACVSALTALAEESKKAIYQETMVCTPQKLKPLSAPKLALDLDKAINKLTDQAVRGTFESADGNIQITFSLRFVPGEKEKAASIQVSELYTKKEGKHWKMIPAFSTPSVIPYPPNPHATYVFQNPGFDDVPAFEVECELKRNRINQDCPTCR